MQSHTCTPNLYAIIAVCSASEMLCDLIDDLSQEHKDLVFNVFADYEISVPDKVYFSCESE